MPAGGLDPRRPNHEEFVTFRLSDYPGATVEDKRSQTK